MLHVHCTLSIYHAYVCTDNLNTEFEYSSGWMMVLIVHIYKYESYNEFFCVTLLDSVAIQSRF